MTLHLVIVGHANVAMTTITILIQRLENTTVVYSLTTVIVKNFKRKCYGHAASLPAVAHMLAVNPIK